MLLIVCRHIVIISSWLHGMESSSRDGFELLSEMGARVRQLRQAKRWSQEDLADHARMHRTYVGGIERGERNITMLMLHRLAEALEVPPRDLLG
jgi:ribosome-binding protein aMBF1 (putative translation factor)